MLNECMPNVAFGELGRRKRARLLAVFPTSGERVDHKVANGCLIYARKSAEQFILKPKESKKKKFSYKKRILIQTENV